MECVSRVVQRQGWRSLPGSRPGTIANVVTHHWAIGARRRSSGSINRSNNRRWLLNHLSLESALPHIGCSRRATLRIAESMETSLERLLNALLPDLPTTQLTDFIVEERKVTLCLHPI